MAKPRDTSSNAIWDMEMQIIFCDLCINEIEIGNRPTTFFNKEGWQNICTKFQESTGRNYSKLQLKNKWDHFKKEWKLWKELKRGATGLGWDPKKKTIDASDEWWKQKLEVVPNAKKFRFGGIDPQLEEKLDLMFEGVIATGVYTMSSSNLVIDNVKDKGKGVVHDESNELSGESDCNLNTNAEFSHLKRPSTSNCKQPASKRGGNSKLISSEVDKIVSAVNSLGAARTNVDPLSKQDQAINEAVKCLNTMEQLLANQSLYIGSVRLMKDDKIRALFMSVVPEFRLAFLQDYLDKPDK